MTCESPEVGDRSYLAHDGKSGVVIDPQSDVDTMMSEANRLGIVITHVLETHIHNDYVSGGLTLARQCGASYVVAADEPVAFESERLAVRGGDAIRTGDLAIDVVHTPGHTPHHLSYIVSVGTRAGALFSGGSMLHEATGRTDIFDAEAAEMSAHAQWRSVRHLAEVVDPGAVLCPTHGFGSFCAVGPVQSSNGLTVADQLASNPALINDEEAFVSVTLRNRRPFPRYYGHIAPMNRSGNRPMYPGQLTRLHSPRAGVETMGAVAVDLRPRRQFARSHLPGAINIEWADSFAAYFGWTVPWGAPATLLADDWSVLEAAAAALSRIGVPEVFGALYDENEQSTSFDVATFADLRQARADGRAIEVLDARDHAEWESGHLRDAQLMPFYCVEAGATLLPRDRDVWVHCARGYRAAIAASLLERFACSPVLIDDVFESAVSLGLTTR